MSSRHPVIVRIDVAGAGSDGGDETVVAVQAAGNILALGASSLKNPLAKVNEFLLPYKPRIEEVNVDVIGVGTTSCRGSKHSAIHATRSTSGGDQFPRSVREPESAALLEAPRTIPGWRDPWTQR